MRDLWHVRLADPSGQYIECWEFKAQAEAERHYFKTEPFPLYKLSLWFHATGGTGVFGTSVPASWHFVREKQGAEEFP